MMRIADVLQEQLKFYGITRAEAAERIGVSESTISNWCVGKIIPKVDDLYKFAVMVDCTIDDIIEWSGYDYERAALHVVTGETCQEKHFNDLIEKRSQK